MAWSGSGNWIIRLSYARVSLGAHPFGPTRDRRSALAGLEARVLLVDDVGPALPPDDTAVLVALLERAQGITDFHGTPSSKGRRSGAQRGAEPIRALMSCQRRILPVISPG